MTTKFQLQAQLRAPVAGVIRQLAIRVFTQRKSLVTMKKLLIAIAILFGGYYLYNADALYGQYLFSQMCENEGGARFYKRVEKGAGWLYPVVVSEQGKKHMGLPADGRVGFFRFKDESGIWFDARLKKMPPYGTASKVIDSTEYTLIEPANLSISVRYTRKYVTDAFNPSPNWLKKQSFARNQIQIIDLTTGEVVASNTGFGYQWTTPDRVILNAPTAVTCPVVNDPNKRDTFATDIYEQGAIK